MNTILYFTAEWCNPCKKVKPLVEEINREHADARFFMIDVDIEMDMAKDFGVQSIPTFVVINDNKEVYRTTGAQTMQQLKEMVNYGE